LNEQRGVFREFLEWYFALLCLLIFIPLFFFLGVLDRLHMRSRGYRLNEGWNRYEKIVDEGGEKQ